MHELNTFEYTSTNTIERMFAIYGILNLTRYLLGDSYTRLFSLLL